jgi:photoactive yellow protein
MEKIDFEGVNLAELLPRIPDSIRNGLPFGLVKLDLTGKILEYNMAEGDLTGVDPAWAMGKNFFDEVALCTKTQAFYGRFVEGVKRGFMNVVFDFTFDHQDIGTNVKVHMFTMPDRLGKKTVMLLVKRSDKPLVMDAFSSALVEGESMTAEFQDTKPGHASASVKSSPNAAPSMQDIVNAVIAAMNQGANQGVSQNARQNVNPPPVVSAPAASTSRHQDILKF